MTKLNADNMKMRAQLKGGVTEVKVLMSHPMETGRKKDDYDRLIPAHFVQLVTATLNGKLVLEAQWGTGISKNPYLTFRLKGAKVGDIIEVAWQDNLGETATQNITVTQV
ncbi:MAG: thiosulfate oxidation carrier complex protein SoxZ [Betaproteobacteria bacterium]